MVFTSPNQLSLLLQKVRFLSLFGPLLARKMLTLAPIGAQRGTKAGQGASFGPMGKKPEKWTPSRVSKTGVGGTATTLWGCGKTSHSEKSIAKTIRKTPFRQTSENGGR